MADDTVRWGVLAALLSLCLVSVSPSRAVGQVATGENLPVVSDTLNNGMRILVLPREGSPTVSFVVKYGVGSVHERLGSTGTAHLLEHLLFKGSTTVGTRNVEAERELFALMDSVHARILAARTRRSGPDSEEIRSLRDSLAALRDSARGFVVSNEFDDLLTSNGARSLNATTTVETTTYYVQMPANRAKLWFVLEADRMHNPVFREFYTERDVVAEERRSRFDNNPAGRMYEEHLATAFRAHPYGVPTIGYMSDIQNLTRGQVRSYYEEYYGARNAVVAVVGDVRTDSILTWAEDYLGRIRPGRRPDPVLTREPEQQGERRTRVVYDAEPQVRIGWHVVDVFHEDTPALQMLSSILTGGRTSRLQRRMVQQERVATYVSSSVGPGDLYPGLFTIQAFPRSPHTTEELEEIIYAELDSLRRVPPDSSELQRVRNQIEASRIRQLESNFGLALQLAGSATLFGDWRRGFQLTDRLRDVRPEDVQRVVRRYFTRKNRTVTTLVPDQGEGIP